MFVYVGRLRIEFKMSHLLFQVDQVSYMLNVWNKVAEAAQEGARAVILLLESHHAASFLQAAARLQTEGLLRTGDFVFIMAESPLPYIKNE